MADKRHGLSTVLGRLDRLERQNHNMKRGVAVLAAIMAFATVALSVGQSFSHTDVVEAREFRVRDATGTIRATLGLDPEGEPNFILSDRNGRGRAGLSVIGDGEALLNFTDADDTVHLALGTTASGYPLLRVYDRAGGERVWLGLSPGESPSLFLFDADKNVTWQTP